MNTATKIALAIIEEKEARKAVPACATWIEIYRKAQGYEITGEQMHRRYINGDMHEKGGEINLHPNE